MRLVSYTRILPFHPDVTPAPIVEQNEHIAKYAKRLGTRVLKQYSDRKNDPKADTAFMQLLEDGIHRRFDTVIVDSVFYAGRCLGQAREILLLTFFPAGIHFIVVEDEFSSFGKTKEEVAKYFWRKDVYNKKKVEIFFNHADEIIKMVTSSEEHLKNWNKDPEEIAEV